MEEDVVQRFAALLGSTDKDTEVVEHLLLTGKTIKTLRAQSTFYLAFLSGLAVACSI